MQVSTFLAESLLPQATLWQRLVKWSATLVFLACCAVGWILSPHVTALDELVWKYNVVTLSADSQGMTQAISRSPRPPLTQGEAEQLSGIISAVGFVEVVSVLPLFDCLLAWMILWPGRASLRAVQVLAFVFGVFTLWFLVGDASIQEWPTRFPFAVLCLLIASGIGANRVNRALARRLSGS